MGEACSIFDYIGRQDGKQISKRDLSSVAAGDVLRAVTANSIWLIEVTGHNDIGCVVGRLTFVSENPGKNCGVPWWHALEPIVEVPAVIGGFLSPEDRGLNIDACIPGRSPVTNIATAAFLEISKFSPSQE